MYVYIQIVVIYIYTHVCTYIYIYIYRAVKQLLHKPTKPFILRLAVYILMLSKAALQVYILYTYDLSKFTLYIRSRRSSCAAAACRPS